jgi:hypothetical protein
LAKVAGGLLPLALVRPWGRVVPRRWLLAGSAGASALLVVYGGLNVLAGTLVLERVHLGVGNLEPRVSDASGGGEQPRPQPAQHPLMALTLLDELPPAGPFQSSACSAFTATNDTPLRPQPITRSG